MLLLLACTGTTLHLGDTDTAPTRPHGRDDTTIEDAGGNADSGDTAPDTGDDGDDTRVFNLDAVHQVTITFTGDARSDLTRDPYTYVPASVTFDDRDLPQVGVRIKGRLGSLRSLDGKSAFKLDFLEYGGERLHGLEKVSLNNMVQDCAKVHELAAYGIHRMTGTPAPRVAYAHVIVDGTDYGLYSVVEDYDDEFLQKNFADPTGNLYDGDYYLWSNGSYTLLDFSSATQQYFQLDEGTDIGMADVAAVTAAIESTSGLDGDVPQLVDLDQHAAFLAVNAWTGHYDSYSYYSNNYRVYFDPGRNGRAMMMPWDPDWAFYSSTNVNGPYGVLSQRCLRDAACFAKVRETVATLDTGVPGSELSADVQTAIDLIEPFLQRDSRLETSLDEIHRCQAELFTWFDQRGAQMAAAGW